MQMTIIVYDCHEDNNLQYCYADQFDNCHSDYNIRYCHADNNFFYCQADNNNLTIIMQITIHNCHAFVMQIT